MALQTNFTTSSNIELASSYMVVTNLQVNKVMNDTTLFNPDTESDETTIKHYRITFMAEVWKDEASRNEGFAPVDAIGEAPGDLSFVTASIDDATGQCYTYLAEFLGITNTTV